MKRLLATLALILAVGTACDSDDVPVLKSRVDVNTPALVKAKDAAGIADCAPGTGQPTEGGLPAITLPCLGGGPDVDLSRLRGPLVVSLWAQYCGPCRTEMPILQRFHQKYGDRVGVLGIDYLDTLPGMALGLMKETGATYPSLADLDGDLSAQTPLPVIRGLPYLIFVDADGRVTNVHPGDVKSSAELAELVEQHLGIRL